MNTKFCPKCQTNKELSDFHACKRYKDGKQIYCIPCRRVMIRDYKRKKYQTDSTFRKQNNTATRKYKLTHPTETKAYMTSYAKLNKNKIDARTKAWRNANREKLRAYWRAYRKHRRANDVEYRILCSLQTRLWFALRSKKVTRTLELVGCTLEKLKAHLESKFVTNMGWYNYGAAWHIDHIKPCSSFDLTDLAQQKVCFHYTNMQPLWATTQIAIQNGHNVIGNINKNATLASHNACL